MKPSCTCSCVGSGLPPAFTAAASCASTASLLSQVRASSEWVLVRSPIAREVNEANFGWVSNITKMVSDTTMHTAVSSLNWGFRVAPTAS